MIRSCFVTPLSLSALSIVICHRTSGDIVAQHMCIVVLCHPISSFKNLCVQISDITGSNSLKYR